MDKALSQGVRPLGLTLFMMEPYVLGLHEGTQLAILIGTTSVLTLLVYAYLGGVLTNRMAALAALAFVLWPVKHEIYASQLFGVNTLSGILVVAAGLLYRRWTRTMSALALIAGLLAYGLSLFIYEIGFLAPLLFYFVERSKGGRNRSAAWFLVPAALYWVFRLTHPSAVISTGRFEISIDALRVGLPSLPSNLIGYQLARNLGYGLWAVWNAPAWFQVFCVVMSGLVGVLAARWIQQSAAEPPTQSALVLSGAGLLSAFALAAPAAMVLVESRHSLLAAVGMGVVVAVMAKHFPRSGASLIVILLLSSQGLALRQAEVSQLQASVHRALYERSGEIRAAPFVVIDIASLADRVSYTWGQRTSNVLRAYWGLHAFAAGGLDAMVNDSLYDKPQPKPPRVAVCAGGLSISEGGGTLRAELHEREALHSSSIGDVAD